MTSRRKFIKHACVAGACLCGFGNLIQAAESVSAVTGDEPLNSNNSLMQDWISTLLLSIDDHEDEAACRKIMKRCAQTHFNHLQMDVLLKEYKGDLSRFITFIEQKWGWKIDYQQKAGVLLADENKNYCVCPMVNKEKGVKSSILCYCSEGFAELMFSTVIGHKVKASVISSIHRGDSRCIYRITGI